MHQLVATFGIFCLLAFSGLFGGSEPGRVHNFSAGPAALRLPVLLRARDSFLNHNGEGAALFEQSHRDHDGPVQKMIVSAASRLRRLLDVPAQYEILYMHGGAHGQFAALPLNLCSENQVADYVVTGFWSQRAHDEGSKQAKTSVIKGVSADGTSLLPSSEWKISNNSCFVHFCASETIDSFEFFSEPSVSPGTVLVGDFTSTLLSRPVDVSKYGVIYASGGKNLGPSGFVVVIVRRDLLNRVAQPRCPSVLSWKAHAESKPIPSIYNTPPVINLWLHELTLEQYEQTGGMPALVKSVQRHKKAVYDVIDNSGFYFMPVNKEHRSAMSVSMTIVLNGKRREDLEKKFVSESHAQGLIQLFGHPVRGGLRVTLYHGVSDEAVNALVKFMHKFRAQNST